MNKFAEKMNQVNQKLAETSDTDVVAPERPRKKQSSVIGARSEAISSIRHQDKVPTVQHKHSPTRIRMWHGHNRVYEALNAESCSDLIDGFQRAGGQQIAAIARKVTDTDEYDYEVICGARRHWTAGFLKKDLLIEVRSIDDRTAFILQDLENRDRQDVSDLERSVDYKKALELYFENDQTAMANYLQINKGNFNKLLYLSVLPKQIVSAYADKRDLKVHHGAVYKKMIDEKSTRKVLMERAKALVGKDMPGKEVFAQLKRPVQSASASRSPIEFGKARLTRQSKKALAFQLDVSGDITPELIKEYQQDINKLLNSLINVEEPV